MRTIAIVNQKGGCGKTITAVNLGAFLAREPRRVLVVDMDPQAHATLALQRDAAEPRETIYDVLLAGEKSHRADMRSITRQVETNLDLAPSDIPLSAISEALAGVHGREDRLAAALAAVRREYDYAIIDCPPNLGLQTFMALKACSEAIIPVDPSIFSLHGIAKLMETLEVLAKKTGHRISVRALITLYTGRSDFVRAVADEIRKHLGDRSFDTIIRHSVKLAEAASHGKPIAAYCRRCVGFDDYQALAREVLLLEEVSPAEFLEEEGAAAARVELRVAGSSEGGRAAAPAAKADGVLFTFAAPDAHCVQLAADFNGWQPEGNEMKIRGGVWQKLLSLPPGRYCYRYVVDGRWQVDPFNSETEASPYGELNSVVEVPQRKAG